MSSKQILTGVRQHLSRIAVDADTTLPRGASAELPTPAERLPGLDPEDLPPWATLLDRGDPLFHAFLRHELMGDPARFRIPKVLPVDEAEAAKYRDRHRTRGAND